MLRTSHFINVTPNFGERVAITFKTKAGKDYVLNPLYNPDDAELAQDVYDALVKHFNVSSPKNMYQLSNPLENDQSIFLLLNADFTAFTKIRDKFVKLLPKNKQLSEKHFELTKQQINNALKRANDRPGFFMTYKQALGLMLAEEKYFTKFPTHTAKVTVGDDNVDIEIDDYKTKMNWLG